MRDTQVAASQAAFYLTTGVWPLLHRRSFERVTGRKVDFWLAQTVGVVVAAIGAGLGRSVVARRPVSPDLRLAAGLSAAGLALIDVSFVAKRRISPIYLLDAAAEAALVAGWYAANRSD
jgi:hypothetical protein